MNWLMVGNLVIEPILGIQGHIPMYPHVINLYRSDSYRRVNHKPENHQLTFGRYSPPQKNKISNLQCFGFVYVWKYVSSQVTNQKSGNFEGQLVLAAEHFKKSMKRARKWKC